MLSEILFQQKKDKKQAALLLGSCYLSDHHSSQLTQLRYGGLRACSCHIQHDCTDQRKTVGISLLIFLSKLLGWTSGRFAGSSILERMIRTEIQTLSLASSVMLDVTSSACFCSSICKNFVAKNNVHDQH